MTAILFVCLGNICRSPLAEGVFRHRAQALGVADRFLIDSAGCGGWHTGEQPDRRSIAVAARHGIDLSAQRARQIQPADFDAFDLILGLDRDNVRHLQRMAAGASPGKARIALYLQEALGLNQDTPDPYYGSDRDFEAVYRLCDQATEALLKKLA